MRETERRQNWLRAFYAAESGVDAGLDYLPVATLPSDPYVFPIPPQNLGTPSSAQCQTTIRPFGSLQKQWIINGVGFVPNSTSTPRWEVEVEVIANEHDFYGNALYSAGDLTIKGGSYTVDGNIFYDEDGNLNIQHPGGVTGDIINGDAVDFRDINDGGDIDYGQLRVQAETQELNDPLGYDHLIDADDWKTSRLPPTFWYDEINQIPNIIYVEGAGDIKMSGNNTMGGFILITSGNCEVSGTVTVNGCLLTVDDLKISGTLNVDGGAWAGDIVANDEGGDQDGIFVNGSLNISHNEDYMNDIKSLMDSLGVVNLVRIVSWQELRRQVR